MIWRPRNIYLPLACIAAGLFALFPNLASATGSLPVSLRPLHFELTANPGDRIRATVYFWNGTDTELPVHIEPADIRPQDDEGHVGDEGESAVFSIKNWIKSEYPDLVVYPKQEIALDFTIDVPTNADPGTHWGGIAVRTTSGSSGGVGIQARAGAILFVTVRGAVKEKLTIENFVVPRFLDSMPMPVAALFRNEGTVHETPDGFIEVRNMFGALVATGTLPMRSVLPGDLRKLTTSIGSGGFLLGRYTVLLSARYGEAGQRLDASALVWVVPWKEYGGWFLVVLVVLGFLVWRRKNLRSFFYVLWTGKPPPRSV